MVPTSPGLTVVVMTRDLRRRYPGSIEAVLGAFVAGVVHCRVPTARGARPSRIGHALPVPFATAGLRVDLGLLGQDDRIAGRGRGGGGDRRQVRRRAVGAKLAGQSNRAPPLGCRAQCPQAEIVIASVGLSLGVFTETAYGTTFP